MSDIPPGGQQDNGNGPVDATVNTVRATVMRGRFGDSARFVQLEWPDGRTSWFRLQGAEADIADWIARQTVQASGPPRWFGRIRMFVKGGRASVFVRAGALRPRGLRALLPGQYIDRRTFQTHNARWVNRTGMLLSLLVFPLWLSRDFWLDRLPAELREAWVLAAFAVIAVAVGCIGRRRVTVDASGVRSYGFVGSRFVPWTDVTDVSVDLPVVRLQLGAGAFDLMDRPQAQPSADPDAAAVADTPSLATVLPRFWTDGPAARPAVAEAVALSADALVDLRREAEWRGYRSNIWGAYWLVAVTLIGATFALGDLVQRSHLRGWTRTTGVIAIADNGDVSIRHSVGDGSTDASLPGWLGSDFDKGAKLETWVHPADPRQVVVAENTPLHTAPYAASIAIVTGGFAGWLLVRARTRRRRLQPLLAGSGVIAAGSHGAPGEWLAAAVVPMAICLGSVGWLVANPEIRGDLQLGLGGLMYLAAMFGVHKWLRADQRGIDAA